MVCANLRFDNGSNLATVAKEKKVVLFLGIYTFLSGFVFIEPSPAEIFFVWFLPLLLMATRWELSFLLENLFLLFLPLFTSTVAGIFQDGFINYRFFIIDIYLFMFYMVMSSAISSKRVNAFNLLQVVMKFWTYAALVNIAVGLYCYATGRATFFNVPIIRFGIRLTGFFKDPNVLGPFVVVPLVYNLDLFINGRDKIKRLFLIILLGVGVLLSFSRAAWLNASVAIMILLGYYTLFDKIRNKIRALLVIFFIVFAIYILFSTNPQIMDVELVSFFKSRLALQSYDELRFSAQSVVLEILQSKSIALGIGPGRYEEYAGMSTHSLYIRYLGERGLFGFSAFIIWVVLRFRDIKKTPQKVFFFSSLFGQFVNSLFIDSLHWRHLWILFVLSNLDFLPTYCRGEPEIL